MEFDPKDRDVVALLAKIKSAKVQYPPELFASRRLGYMRRVAEIGLGIGVAPELKNTPKVGSGGSAATKIGGLFEAVLLSAILVEAGVAAYIYRDQILNVIQSYISATRLPESVPSPNGTTPLLAADNTDLPQPSETSQAVSTNSPTTTATVVPTVIAETNEAVDNAKSTPDLKGNNGNQYGKTPKPERTKDNENNKGGKDKDK